MCRKTESHPEHDPVFKLLCFPLVPVMNRPVITGYPAVNISAAAAFGAHVLPARQISAGLADRINRRQRIIRNIITGGYAVQQITRLFPVVKFTFHINVEYSSCRIKRLQPVLMLQRLFQCAVVVRRQLRAVRVIRHIPLMACGSDSGIFFFIQHGKTVGS